MTAFEKFSSFLKNRFQNSTSENLLTPPPEKKEGKCFAYLDLLTDNAPQAYKEYNGEAEILHKQIDKNLSVRNIAVVAKYGAGKSSVINTYLKKYRNKKGSNPAKNKYTRITLSTFNEAKYDDSAIERSILQQLLYSRKHTKLPNSEIKRTNKTSKWVSLGAGLVIALFFVTITLFGIEISGTHLFHINGIRVEGIEFILLSFAAILLCAIIYELIHYQQLKRIKIKDFEADIRANDDTRSSEQVTSLINKFIDEVLYFFECVDINLVIFEDLDRLYKTDIFVKLRELNTIINGSRDHNRGEVTFLYAVKDDLFKTEEERAKFFEFILPVVPVINPVTTEEELRNKLENLINKNSKMKLHDRFIKGIAGYIPDMRVLKNTFNDYIIMFHKIFEDKNAKPEYLSTEKLFALCLYKNLFPYDYALLENNKGLIPIVVDIKRLRALSVKKINTQIEETKAWIETLKSEKLTSFEELKAQFIGQITQLQLSRSRQIYDNPVINALEIETFDKLNFARILHPFHNGYKYGILQNGQTEILTPSGERYEDKERMITDKCNNGIEKKNAKIAELEKEKQTILKYTFAKIITKHGVPFCFLKDTIEQYKQYGVEFNEKQIKEQLNFLRFLVAQEYIDEHYIEYTSNYKAQLISPKDVKFILSLQRHEQDFECIQDDIDAVITRLDENDFKHTAILNRKLLSCIETVKTVSHTEKSKKYNNLLVLLSNTTEESTFEAIEKFIIISEKNDCDILLKEIIPTRQVIFAELLLAGNLTIEKLDIVFANILWHATDYKLANSENQLVNYINAHDDYLNLLISVGDNKKVIKFIDEISPCFKQISNNDLEGEIQHYIIVNNKYTLTLENLETIFNIADKTDKNVDFYTKNYDYISTAKGSDTISSIVEYINGKLNTYVKEVLLNDRITLCKEPQERVEFLIKSPNIELEVKKGIIVKSNIKVENITDFDVELFSALIDNDAIQPTWSNILLAFEKKGFECIKAYLVQKLKLEGSKVLFSEKKKDEERILNFCKELLRGVTAVELEKIVLPTVFLHSITELEIEGIDDDNLSIYIGKDHSVVYNGCDLPLLYNKPKSLCAYLKFHVNHILNNFDDFFDCVLPQKTEKTIRVVKNHQYVNKQQIIYSEKPNANTIIAAVIACSGIDIKIKKTLVEKCWSIIQIAGHEMIYADNIIKREILITPGILWQFTSSNISINYKMAIFEACSYVIKGSDTPNIIEFVKSFGEPYTSLFDKKEEIRIEKSESVENFLKVLIKEKNIITYRSAKTKNEFIVKLAVHAEQLQ
ncbi:MAG: hypothetical protein LBI42_08400 [Chitinispirillales bacterium]|jgi:hypothetical protein|nr:hypothetical protein [Chitinispirillales bacterium]